MGARLWKVGELAKATGLTVRTLHYYEEFGLLAPSRRTDAGHRLYAEAEVVRLQQIVSLRHLGFPLEEIRECLRSAALSPQRVLELHLARLREQVALQQRLCKRLEALAGSLRSAESVSVEQFIEAIEGITRMEKYYTSEQHIQIQERAQQIGEEQIRQGEADWAELISQVRAEMDGGTDPSDGRVRALAKRWGELVKAFTGGDPGIAHGVGRMWQEETTIHGFDTAEMRKLMEYVAKAGAFE